MRREKNFRNGRSFAGGAAMLAASNIVCRLLGFFFKIPLANLIGREGMGYFNFAGQIFGVVSVIAVSGMPVALARMVAESTDGGRKNLGTRGILRQALLLFAVVGLTGSVILLFFAHVISDLAGSEPSWYCVRMLAPSSFFIAMTAAFRGYYQGMSDMVPTAVSQIVEACVKLAVGIAAAFYLYENGYPPEIVAAGAVAGITVGTIAGFAVLALIGKKREREMPRIALRIRERSIKRRIILTSLPVTMGAFFGSLINTIDAMVIMNRLQYAAFTTKEATELYGAYTGYAVTLYAFPFAITSAIAASILPVVAAAAARGQTGGERMKKSVNTALRLTSLVAFPAAAIFCLLPGPVLSLLFSRGSDVEIAAPLLAGLSGATVLAALSSVTSAILQAAGKTNITIAAAAAGGLIKLASNYILIGNRDININGAPIGTTICCFIVFLVNIAAIYKCFGFMPRMSDILFKPAICGALAAFVAYWSYTALNKYMSAGTSVLTGLLAAAAVYVTALILTGAVKNEDRALIPFKKRR